MWIEDDNKNYWDNIISKNNGHIKQTYFWGEIKKSAKWECLRIKYVDKSDKKDRILQLLYKKKLFIVFIYIAGSIINDNLKANSDLLNFLKKKFKKTLIYIRYHNESELDDQYCNILKKLNWKRPLFFKSQNQIITKNLNSSEDLLKSYKQKWRYNLKKTYEKNFKVVIQNNMTTEEILDLSDKHSINKRANKAYFHHKYQIQPLIKHFKNKLIFGKVLFNNNLIALRVFIIFNNTAWNYMNINDTNAIKLKVGYSLIHKLSNEFIKMGIKKISLGELNKKQFPGVYQFNTGYNKDIIQTNGEFVWSNSKILFFLIEKILKNYLNEKKNLFSFFIPDLKI